MGMLNNRAICPNCGGKIHTQARGLGHLTLSRSGPPAQTGTECQFCGVALTGKVGIDNRAIRAEDAGKSFLQRNAPTGESKVEQWADEKNLGLLAKTTGRIERQLAEAVAKHGEDSKQAKKLRGKLDKLAAMR